MEDSSNSVKQHQPPYLKASIKLTLHNKRENIQCTKPGSHPMQSRMQPNIKDGI